MTMIKKEVIIITFLILVSLLFTKSVKGSSKVNVKIENDINSSNSSSYSETSNSSTNVHIQQSGEGTSQVTINGKQWKLDGPGEINVNENSSDPITPTQNPHPSVTPNTTASPTQSAPIPTVNPGQQEEEVRDFFDKLKEYILSFFTSYFGQN